MGTIVPTWRAPKAMDVVLACKHVARGITVRWAGIIGETYPGEPVQPNFAACCLDCFHAAGDDMSKVRYKGIVRLRGKPAPVITIKPDLN